MSRNREKRTIDVRYHEVDQNASVACRVILNTIHYIRLERGRLESEACSSNPGTGKPSASSLKS